MKATYCHLASLGTLGLGALVMYGCAVQQPMVKAGYTPVQDEQAGRTRSLSMFAAKKVSAAATSEPQAPVAAEPSPQPQADVEPAPEPQPQAAAEPAPKPRGPLTQTEENEIDTQVMP